jgi:hypothetical protein
MLKSQSSTNSIRPTNSILKQFNNVPPIVHPSKINNITDINYLLDLEYKYDNFLEANQQLLDLYNIIDELLDIRNAVTIQISRLERKKQIIEHNKKQEQEQKKKQQEQRQKQQEQGDKREPNLNLTQDQKNQGYIPCQNGLKEYKCGCKIIQYQKQKQKQKQKQREITVIQKQHYCFKHLHYLKTKHILDDELTKINIELSSITKKENEL